MGDEDTLRASAQRCLEDAKTHRDIHRRIAQEEDTCVHADICVLALHMVTVLFFGKPQPEQWHGVSLIHADDSTIERARVCMGAMLLWVRQYAEQKAAHRLARTVCRLACGPFVPTESMIGWSTPLASAPNSRSKQRGTPTLENSLPLAVLGLPLRHGLRRAFVHVFVRLLERTQIQAPHTMRSCLRLCGLMFSDAPDLALPGMGPTKTLLAAADELGTDFVIVDQAACVVDDAVMCELVSRHAGFHAWEDVVRRYDAHRAQKSNQLQFSSVERDMHWLSCLFHVAIPLFRRPLGLPAVLLGQFATAPGGSTPATVELGQSIRRRLLPRRYERPGDGPFEEKVHAFAADEVRRLYLACETTLEHLVMCLLFTTALRIGGVCRIRRCHVATWDASHNAWVARPRGSTLEKGHHFHTFTLTPRCQKLLEQWLNNTDDGKQCAGYVFPERPRSKRQAVMALAHDTHPTQHDGTFESYHKEGDGHCEPNHVRRVFRDVADRAGLSGVHVRPHACRHTVAVCLNLLGNRMEHIAEFLGNIDLDVTARVYARLSARQREERMVIPWLDGNDVQRKHRLREAAELAAALAGPVAGGEDPVRFQNTGAVLQSIETQWRELGLLRGSAQHKPLVELDDNFLLQIKRDIELHLSQRQNL